jgi:hypothetical protein
MSGGDLEKKTWTPQQIPSNVSGTQPKPDHREPSPEPPKEPKERR